jgi:phosphotransferase system  glucose/maltose/N-acetylglucosamine-specific IIC component
LLPPVGATLLLVIVALLASAVFGAGVQYVSSLTRFWDQAWQLGALSAPWLVLPFLVGRAQRSPRRAAVLGAAATLTALLAYALMTLSPVEHARLTVAGFEAFVRTNATWFLGGVLTGPLFGWLGHRWRVVRTPAALAVAALVALEPVVHAAGFRTMPLSPVTEAEVACGLAMAMWFGWRLAHRPRPAQPAGTIRRAPQ